MFRALSGKWIRCTKLAGHDPDEGHSAVVEKIYCSWPDQSARK